MSLYHLTLYDIICRNARLYPDRAAWREAETGEALTFSAYKAAVDRTAAGLLSIGFQKGDRLGVIGKNTLAYVVLYGAAAALGGILVGINWRLAADEMAYNLNDVQPRFVFADNDDPSLMASVKSKLADTVQWFNLQAHAGAFANLPDAPVPTENFPPRRVTWDDGWVIIHTAAVSGRPRGALLSHGNLLCANVQLMHQVAITPDDVLLNPLPLFHIAGLGMSFCCFHAGALTILMPKFDAAQAVTQIAKHNVRLLFAFAPMMQQLLGQVEQSGTGIPSLRAVLGIDRPDIIERYQQLTGGSFYALFGQTETAMVVTMSKYGERPGSAGRPIPLVDVRIVDDDDQPVAQGQAGEIVVRGPMVFKGYWGLAAENAHAFRNGWHHTGDLGRFDGDGYLWYVARKAEKELIKPGGENVYPAEVEKVILEHPAVAAVAVIGVPDAKWGEAIKAVCQLKPGQRLTDQELIDFVGRRIARYKKPQYVQFVEELPVIGGHLDRAKVKKRFGGRD
jgi:long-chain acyl-CoA synthetase